MVLLGVFRYFASIADKLPSEFFDQGSIYSAVIYEPYGVCAAILPFNWPPVHVAGKAAPCLAAGNTMVLKPGEQSPLTAMRIVNILQSVFPYRCSFSSTWTWARWAVSAYRGRAHGRAHGRKAKNHLLPEVNRGIWEGFKNLLLH